MPAKEVTLKVKKPKAVKPAAKLAGEGKSSAPLILEPHPSDYKGFPFITLIQYRKAPMLVIVDNTDGDTIKAFVLDLCGPERVNEELVILAASEWYENNRSKFPVSIEFSRRGITCLTSKIYRSLNIEFVSRVIGPAPMYPMANVKSIKRRRRKSIPATVEVEKPLRVLATEELFNE